MTCVRRSRRTGCGAASCLVREEASLHAVHQHRTETARNHLTKAEGLGEDAPKDRGQKPYVSHNHKDCHCKIDARHEGHNQIQHLCRCMLSQNNHCRDCDQHNGRVERRNAKGILKGRGDRVSDHLADTAPANQRGDRKENRHDIALTAEFALFRNLRFRALSRRDAPLCKEVVNVVSRTAPVTAVERILFLVELRECRLDKGRRSTDDCSDPHPKDRTGATRRDGRDHADQVAHAHARRGRDDERLHAREPSARGIRSVLALLLFKQHGNHLREQAERQNPRPYRIEYARRNQQQYHEREPDRTAARQRNSKQIAPQKLCHTLNDCYHWVHPLFPLFCNCFFALTC